MQSDDVVSGLESTRGLGSLLREQRLALGLTQEALSRRSGVDRTVIGRVERDGPFCTVFTLARLAEALDLSLQIRAKEQP